MSDADLDIFLPPPSGAEPLAAASASIRAAGRRPKPARGVPTVAEFCRDWLGIRPTPAQTVMLKVTFGEPLDDGELPLFRQLTGRTVDLRRRFANASAVASARGGKSGFYAAPSVLYRAAHTPRSR